MYKCWGENNASFMQNIWYFDKGNRTGFEFNSQVEFVKPLKKSKKRLSKKHHDGQNEFTVLLWRASVLRQSLSPIKLGCTAPGWQWFRLGALMRQSGSSLSPDLSFDLSPSQPMNSPVLPPKFIYSKFHQQISTAQELQKRNNWWALTVMRGHCRDSSGDQKGLLDTERKNMSCYSLKQNPG